MSDTFTAKQACEALGITHPTLVRMIKAGKIRANKAGKKWLISRQSVREFLGDKPSLEDLISGRG